ncbi:MAG: site-2 protease family protein [Puniceicoccales bacterium]|nr:site-2 protease family protein [Puniceicoccales bacterium]
MLKLIFSGIWQVFLVILFFCGSIVVHEFGHYLAAKVRGLYVPRFSIGFGPALWKKKIGETEFRVALLPFGGYVSLPQLSNLKEIEGKFDLPKDLKSATCTDKVVVAIMGPVANVLFAMVLSCILWRAGLPIDSSMLSRTVGYVEPTLLLDDGDIVMSPARTAGMKAGDEIVMIDGFVVNNFNDIQKSIALGGNRDIFGYPKSSMQIVREGRRLNIELKPVLVSENGSDRFRKVGILPKQELVIGSIPSGRGRIEVGDQILRINDVNILHIRSLHERVSNRRSVKLEVLRNGNVVTTRISTVPMAVEKPYAILSFGDAVADIIPFYLDNVDKSTISESTGAKLLLFSEQCEDLQKYNFANGMEIIKINGCNCHNLYDIAHAINRYGANTFAMLKSDTVVDVVVPEAQVRLVPAVYTNIFDFGLKTNTVTLHKSPFEQIRETIATTFQTLGGLFNKNSDISIKHLMGPTGLIRTLHMFSKTDIRLLLWFVVLININLAILNMIPLPVLDGGYVAISLMEKATGGKYVAKIFGILQSVFLFILFGLLIYVSFFDVKRWVADGKSHEEYSRQARLKV